jgi:hypothetical protein
MGILFTNNAEGTLTAGVGSGDTTDMDLTAGDGVLFPTVVLGAGNYFYATLVDSSGNREIVQITEHQAGTDVFQTFVRAQDDTDAIGFSIGDKVQLRLPKVILAEFRDDIATNISDLTDYETSNDIDIAAIQAKSTADEQVLYAPSGLTMFIYNPAGEIPTGWSAKSGPADCLLAIAGGAQDYNVAGENLAGSWTPTVHAHTGPSHVHTMNTHVHTMPTHLHTTPSHALSVAEMPAHSHLSGSIIYPYTEQFSMYGRTAATATYGKVMANLDRYSRSDGYQWPSQSIGSGAAHAHGNTGATDPGDTNATDPGDTNASGTANTGTGSAPSTDRPYAAVGLLIERD